MSNGKYMIVNITRGLFDGTYFYDEKEMPRIVEYWKECFPEDDIFYVDIKGKPKFTTPDSRWMPNYTPNIGRFARSALAEKE